MATAHLLQRIIEMTDAKTDQEHLDVVVFNRPATPDRTAYLLNRSNPSPLPSMRESAQTLERLGCTCLCAPCVTSHYFYPELAASVSVPFLNMVKETAAELKAEGRRKTGILATSGTVGMGLFQKALEELGIEWAVPDERGQTLVMSLIYDDIKAGKPADREKFRQASAQLFAAGCDSIILGCTELSLVRKDSLSGPGYLDALELLSKRCVETCHAPLKAEYRSLLE